jgi:ribosomal protein S18 acetylase RimI-like enzyme
VARTALSVRPATVDDLPALLVLGEQLRDQLLQPVDGRARALAPAAARALLEQRYRDALADPDRHVVLAVGPEQEPLGMALLVVGAVSALLDVPAVHVSHAVVADRHRRRGAGKALVAAALSFAEQRGIEQLVVSVNPSSREANRFFARLGFAPLAVRRAAPVSVVRRHLTQPEGRPVDVSPLHRPRRRVRLPSIALGSADSDA